MVDGYLGALAVRAFAREVKEFVVVEIELVSAVSAFQVGFHGVSPF